MALPDDLKSLSASDVEEEILKTKRELFNLRFQQGTRQLEKPHLFKANRRRLAQLLTIERQRQLAQTSAE